MSLPFFTANEAITNLAFAEGTKSKNDILLYATTELTVRSFRLISPINSITSSLRERKHFHLSTHQNPTSNNQPAQFDIAELESRMGCAPGCAVLATSELDGERQFLIANSTGVFSYVGDDRRLALAIEGEKLAIHWWFNYLITVSKESRRAVLSTPMNAGPSTGVIRPPSNIISQLSAK